MLKTNSGLSILLRCSRNFAFHGAGCGDVVLDVDAILRCSTVRVNCVSRDVAFEAMVAVLLQCVSSSMDLMKASTQVLMMI